MKVVHVVFAMKYGGIETMLVNIANEQINYADVAIIMINDSYDRKLIKNLNKRIKFINIGRPTASKNPYYVVKLNYLIWKLNPDIIHSHIGSIISYILPIFRKKSVFTVHSIPSKKHLQYVHKYTAVCAISSIVQNQLRIAGCPSKLIVNGIKVDSFECCVQTNNSTFRIVQVGRLLYSCKGQDLLIEACHKLINEGISNLEIDFIGDGVDREYLQELVKKYNLESYITFYGSKEPDYIEKNLKNYSLFVQPSRYEGFGLTVAEAMAVKIPVLVSGQEGPMEIIENGKCGFYFESENIDNLVNSIKNIMQYDKMGMSQIVNRAYDRVKSLYDVKITAKRYIELYHELI